MAKLFYSHKRDYKPNYRYEVNNEPSQTVVNDSMTIKQIIDRFTIGQDVPRKNPVYMDAELDQIDSRFSPNQDLTDVQANQARINREQQIIEQEQQRMKNQEESENTDATNNE